MIVPAGSGSTVRALGLDFPGPVGLAAGFDRDASRIDEILEWGFGFVELGTVTPQPVPDHNPGAAVLAANLARNQMRSRAIGTRPVIGVSLGMQPGSSPEDASSDYVRGMRALWSRADYLVLNFTSTAAQRLHAKDRRGTLLALLAHAQEERQRLAVDTGRGVPLLIKWPVGPSCNEAVRLARRIRALRYDGMVAAFDAEIAGALTWEAWVPRACRSIAEALGPEITLVAVGGVDCARRAVEVRRAGATLVQVYRGFVRLGPALVHAVARGLRFADCAVAAAAQELSRWPASTDQQRSW
jgi:dihydroorotate dehydrogenase